MKRAILRNKYVCRESEQASSLKGPMPSMQYSQGVLHDEERKIAACGVVLTVAPGPSWLTDHGGDLSFHEIKTCLIEDTTSPSRRRNRIVPSLSEQNRETTKRSN